VKRKSCKCSKHPERLFITIVLPLASGTSLRRQRKQRSTSSGARERIDGHLAVSGLSSQTRKNRRYPDCSVQKQSCFYFISQRVIHCLGIRIGMNQQHGGCSTNEYLWSIIVVTAVVKAPKFGCHAHVDLYFYCCVLYDLTLLITTMSTASTSRPLPRPLHLVSNTTGTSALSTLHSETVHGPFSAPLSQSMNGLNDIDVVKSKPNPRRQSSISYNTGPSKARSPASGLGRRNSLGSKVVLGGEATRGDENGAPNVSSLYEIRGAEPITLAEKCGFHSDIMCEDCLVFIDAHDCLGMPTFYGSLRRRSRNALSSVHSLRSMKQTCSFSSASGNVSLARACLRPPGPRSRQL
jgi:hypothetical protein